MKIQKLLILLFLSIILPKILRGQEQEESLNNSAKTMIKINLVEAVNFFEPTLAASIEHKLVGKHYLEHEIGYVYAKPLDLPEGTHGLSYRLGYHFVYIEEYRIRKYVGVSFHYRELLGEVQDFVWRKNFGYQQKVKYKNNLTSYGFSVLLGATHFWGKSSRWFTDYQFGLGLSWKPLRIDNYPADAENPKYVSRIYSSSVFVGDGTTRRNGENPVYTNVLLALKIGYVIR